MDYSPRGRKESDTTEELSMHEAHTYICMHVYVLFSDSFPLQVIIRY